MQNKKMKIGIVDADLLDGKGTRFPNLAAMKLSAFHKWKGSEVDLLTSWLWGNEYDHVFISKVFTSTKIPFWIKPSEKISLGGTGFYFDNAPSLHDEIEHIMPDYTLYDSYIKERIKSGVKASIFYEYQNNSIGFLTRGCFRKCHFCVNKNSRTVQKHSDLFEFLKEDRKAICLLDDNFFGYKDWKKLFQELIDTGKPFKFKQGLDERLLTDEKCEMLFNCKYDGDYIFAFDNIADYYMIESKLELIRKYTSSKNIKFYVLVGFESVDVTDIKNMFLRIELLVRYSCLPYIMRFRGNHNSPWEKSKFSGIYTTVARWCNQPKFFKTLSFREFCEADRYRCKSLPASMRSLIAFEKEYPEIAKLFFDMKYKQHATCNHDKQTSG